MTEAPISKHLPSPKRLRAGRPNPKQTPMFKIRNLKQEPFGHLNLGIEIYLIFGPALAGLEFLRNL